MESARFNDLSYLEKGTPLQRKSYALIHNHQIMQALHEFNPILIGTIPIDIAVWNSDLDIACEVYDLDKFERKCHENFEKHNGYSFKVETVRGIEVGIANFKIDDMLLEVYGEGAGRGQDFRNLWRGIQKADHQVEGARDENRTCFCQIIEDQRRSL